MQYSVLAQNVRYKRKKSKIARITRIFSFICEIRVILDNIVVASPLYAIRNTRLYPIISR